MSWARKYIGKPYSNDDFDCWGLVRDVYERELSIQLPSYSELYSSALEVSEVASAIQQGITSWEEVDAGKERAFDVGLFWFVKKSEPCHVGVVHVPGEMLHARQTTGTTLLERYDRGIWRPRLIGIFRLRR